MRFRLRNKYPIALLATLLLVALPACKGGNSQSSAASSQQVAEQAPSVQASQADVQEMLENPTSPVIDVAGILKPSEIQAIMEKAAKLDSLNLAQVAVVTINDLGGRKILDYAVELSKKWGVGHKETNDGITIMIKPKTADSKGEVTIATGLGMEKLLTNEMCKEIIDTKMLPKFKG